MSKNCAVTTALVIALAVGLERRLVATHCNASACSSFVDPCVCKDGNDQNGTPLTSTDCHPGRSSLIADTFFYVCPCSVRVRATWACGDGGQGIRAFLTADSQDATPGCDRSAWQICFGQRDGPCSETPFAGANACDGSNWSANGIIQAGNPPRCPIPPTLLKVYLILRGDQTPCDIPSSCTNCKILRWIGVLCQTTDCFPE